MERYLGILQMVDVHLHMVSNTMLTVIGSDAGKRAVVSQALLETLNTIYVQKFLQTG